MEERKTHCYNLGREEGGNEKFSPWMVVRKKEVFGISEEEKRKACKD